ncbi:PucR family transcriptional regulator ligand-binding domain-containing protein [Mycobacterium sp. shizuoka-1]|uniref:PucR family transcriptional regulator n=1 Tax=Mycobacterium sp. shizuoka-1 TaxID=2039281 RepID=UPI000C06770A|nr:PucR family transcriptional regulator ligand-binding domain-containing protein [Mycobacterium sp. shizuoka-1]GAY16894.1 putative regulatory protein [Mycobacterium sp. shizuoka-1]
MQLTLSDILRLPSIRAGEPQVVCPGPMDRPVRWVHVSDLADLSGLLTGGELVLTTGQALADPARREAYLPGLAAAGAAGVVVELGLHIDALDESVRRIGTDLALPVVVLHRPVRFIDITEEVHRRIVADQYAEVAYGQRVHEEFTALSMRRASVDQIVSAAAEMLDTPVVLEGLNRQVLAFDARGVPATELLADWERRSRLTTGDTWTACPVGPYREEWGRLIAPRLTADGRAVMTLERAAQALALHRMVEQNRSSLELRAQSGLVDDLRRGRITDEAEATARAHALGLRPALTYLPMAVRLRESTGADQVAVAQRRVRTLDAIMHTVRAAGHTGLAATRDDGQVDLVLAPQRSSGPASSPELILDEVCSAIRRAVLRLDGVDDATIGVGPESSRLVDAVGGLREAGHVAEVAMSMPVHDKPFHRASDVRLRGLLSLIRSDPQVQAFAETELAGLLAHRAKHGDEAFDLLRRFLDAGGNKAELARTLHMSRPTLYSRLEALARIIGLDLDDAESRTSLHVAMLILNPAGE